MFSFITGEYATGSQRVNTLPKATQRVQGRAWASPQTFLPVTPNLEENQTGTCVTAGGRWLEEERWPGAGGHSSWGWMGFLSHKCDERNLTVTIKPAGLRRIPFKNAPAPVVGKAP